MASNGVVARKPSITSKLKADDAVSIDSLFDDIDIDGGKDVMGNLKEKLPKVKNAGAWTAVVDSGVTPREPTAKSLSSINKVPAHLSKAYTYGDPMTDKPDIFKCNHCKRPVAKHAMNKHVEACLNKKQEKQRKKKEAKDARDAAARKEKAGDSDDDDEDGSKKTASKTGGMTASKKRKAADEGEEGPTKKKKKKDDPKAKAKPKAPVDVEKQCGVELPQGGQCARSLTCKSHSMGAKRAVPGRSAPYDKLLMEYQRKNQAKLQKAAFDANAPNPDDEVLTGPVDSEDEKDAVMASIARSWGGRPVQQPVHVPLRSKYTYNRYKGMLSSAFAGSRGGTGMFSIGGNVGGFFGSVPHGPTIDADGMVHARKGSVVPGARSMIAPAARKPSVASGS